VEMDGGRQGGRVAPALPACTGRQAFRGRAVRVRRGTRLGQPCLTPRPAVLDGVS
jgi:hypothetical protein